MFFHNYREVKKMRLGELRSQTKDLDNRLFVYVSNYDGTGEHVKALEIDIATDNAIFFRVVDED